MVKKVRKRSGKVVDFNKEKIIHAISKAGYVKDVVKEKIAQEIESLQKEVLDIEELQDLVEKKLMASQYKSVAKEYIRYRYARELVRKSATSNSVLDILNLKNQDINEENSNKNPVILSTQRDYMAGELSKDISRNLLIPEDVLEAHDSGIIHFHDMDYFAQNMYNCCLVNLEDMFQNGTCINGTLIEKPHSFATACNIATQVMAQIASNEYGGQSETLSHLAPFVDISRKKYRKEVKEELESIGVSYNEDNVNSIAEKRLKEEIKRGVQTMQYQINTLMTSNGQTPFVTLFMYLGEVADGRLRDDLALIIEEVVKQRLQGTKNTSGVYVTPAFPKLIYVLEESNIHENSKYWYLTKLCAKCTSKRLVPDYLSEKNMKKYKEGNCFPPMGERKLIAHVKPIEPC